VRRLGAAIPLSVALLSLALLVGHAFAADGGEALPEIGSAPPFELVSQDGTPVSLIGLRGRVVVVSFFFAGCSTICPLLTQKLVEVQDALGGDFGRKIQFVSITLDPEHDTQDVLKDYATAWNAKLSGWSFLTGPPAVVQQLVDRYGVYAASTAEGAIDHTLLTSIVDQHGILRVQYLGMRFDPIEFRRDLLSLVAPQ
jgi:protein SCO1